VANNAKPMQPKHPARARPTTRRAWLLLALSAIVPLAITMWLCGLRVPLGLPDRFVYLYSPPEVIAQRFAAVPPAAGLAALLAISVWLLGSNRRPRRRAGSAIAVLAALGVGVWAYAAPPDHIMQHTFNMQSPSHDGAFLKEAFQFEHLRDYLADFPLRAALPPEQMRGTRVISNPPGATVIAYGLRRLVEWHTPLGDYLRAQFDLDEPELASFRHEAAVGLLYAWVLTGLWLAAGPFLYALGRLYLAPPAALAFCLCVLLCPPTLLFTPGKDPAQLLTATVPLWLWLLALKQRSPWLAGLSGAAWLCAGMMSLIHVWLAAIAVAAGLWSHRHDRHALLGMLRSGLLPALAGAVLAAVALRIALGLDFLATAATTAQAQAQVTRGPDAMPLAWQMLGLPLFLLFAGPALWAGWLWLAAERPGSAGLPQAGAPLGTGLLVGSGIVLLATIGFTNMETPRLWIPFVPLLLMGAALRLRVFTSPETRRPVLATLVGLQVLVSACQWALMDMREAETRLLHGHFFW